MFLRFLFLGLILVSVSAKALTVTSIAHGDWENANTWSNHQLPGNPDTILVRHYVTVNQNFSINAPTVLFIEASGTICGNYLMQTICGAGFINYGHIYVNQIKTTSGLNYNLIYCATSIMLTACSTSGYFSSMPPNGHVEVWPPVACKTPNTNWEGGTSTGIHELKNTGIALYPNPVIGQFLTVVSSGQTSFKLTDPLGNLIYNGVFSDASTIDVSSLSTGMYFLELEVNGKRYLQKLVKAD